MKYFNLCLLGFGNVGQALVRLLVEKEDALYDEFGVDWCVTGIATRRTGWLAPPAGFETEARSLLGRPQLDHERHPRRDSSGRHLRRRRRPRARLGHRRDRPRARR
ncbi:MAG: hypothetical protein LC795_10405 [Acidobacteria bacterium]|nr:hypothetical protein [Acidobacteriota bacterium]